MADAIPVGLRVDVDTLRGTRFGVPMLVELFERHNVKATFFMSVGPDNMGRNLWRLLKPRFLAKVLRSRAPSLYGWDILLRGTAWPGPIIGQQLPVQVCLPFDAGHEVGLHAWDHFTWQWRLEQFSAAQRDQHLQRGYDLLADILGQAPRCSAAAGWRCDSEALLAKENFSFAYNSDCRGDSIFRPRVQGRLLAPQIPVTLPTYDEVVGRDGITAENFNDRLLDWIRPGELNVYTVHAEVEGLALLSIFDDLLRRARERNIVFKPLSALLPAQVPAEGSVKKMVMPGRDGWMAVQEVALS